MPVLSVTSLETTSLFGQLKQLESEGSCPAGLPGNLLSICGDASARLKIFPAVHGQFTLHDEVHSLRVVQLMSLVLGTTLGQLNAVEIALLILSAYFHDQGMVVGGAEIEAIKSSEEWKLHEQNWRIDHPNYREVVGKIEDPLLSAVERERLLLMMGDLHAAMFTDYIRRTHGQRSAAYVRAQYADDARLTLYGRSIVDLLATICFSHVRPAESITPANGFAFDELVGTAKVNVGALAYALRLADILDFDRERTPESLYRAVHFTSAVSLLEWAKHRSVVGWDIAPDRIVFSAECSHPAYERSIREFFDWIDDELSAAEAWGRSLPAQFQRYRLELPAKVDRGNVRAYVDPITRQPAYRYFDLEFSLSRDEIVKLLMTDRLYANRRLFIRELLQNALDALRHRRALYSADGVALSDLKVHFEHVNESGFDVVRCTDNGVGMDESIVTRFLTRAGRSYYRSAEFERERRRFKEKGCDFDPCARFGIGFMSCFMFGDEITIRTRRDYGLGRGHAQPLVVEIKGLSGIVVIRPGDSSQAVGTTIEVRGRKKSFTVDEWSDPVNLIEVLQGYTLAAEFPVTANCRVETIEGQITIAPATSARRHLLEDERITKKVVFQTDVGAVDPRLRGEIRVATLADEVGLPTLDNGEAFVELKNGSEPNECVVVLREGGQIEFDSPFENRQVCCDGILVVGRPGREKSHSRLGHFGCNDGFGSASFMIDARGDLKPELTPARTPPEALFREEPSWERLFDVAGGAYSRILDEIAERCNRVEDPERFWLVAEGYNLDPYHLRLLTVWRRLLFPFATGKSAHEWLSVRDLGRPILTVSASSDEPWKLSLQDGRTLAIPDSIRALQGRNGSVTTHLFKRILMGLSTIVAATATEFALTLQEPDENLRLADLAIRQMPSWRWFFRFGGGLTDVVCVSGQSGFANADHPVIRYYRSTRAQWRSDSSPLNSIIARLVWGNIPDTFAGDVAAGSWTARSRKQLAALYRAVDMSAVPPELRPPYRIFRPGVGVEELTTTHFEMWGRA